VVWQCRILLGRCGSATGCRGRRGLEAAIIERRQRLKWKGPGEGSPVLLMLLRFESLILERNAREEGWVLSRAVLWEHCAWP